jgi:hypothetical protein
MPPQAFALAVGLAGPLGWNYQRSRVGKPTISMFMRRHPVVFVAGVLAGHGVVDGWLVPHILKRP